MWATNFQHSLQVLVFRIYCNWKIDGSSPFHTFSYRNISAGPSTDATIPHFCSVCRADQPFCPCCCGIWPTMFLHTLAHSVPQKARILSAPADKSITACLQIIPSKIPGFRFDLCAAGGYGLHFLRPPGRDLLFFDPGSDLSEKRAPSSGGTSRPDRVPTEVTCNTVFD